MSTSQPQAHFELLRQAEQKARTTGAPTIEGYFQDLNTRLFDSINALQVAAPPWLGFTTAALVTERACWARDGDKVPCCTRRWRA